MTAAVETPAIAFTADGFACSCGTTEVGFDVEDLDEAAAEHLADVHGLTCDGSPSGRHGRGPRCGFCGVVLWGREDQ